MTKIQKIASLIIVLVIVFVVAAFLYKPGKKITPSQDKLNIVTTTYPLYLFARNVAGDAAHVENLLPFGTGPHEYAPTPSDIVRLSRADIVIKNGARLDDWINEMIKTAGKSELIAIDMSSGMALLPSLDEEEGGGPDPHFWIDPVLVERLVKKMSDEFIRLDPPHRLDFEQNTAAYLDRLRVLDESIKTTLYLVPRRDFVAFHPAFQYFAKRYDLELSAAIEPTPGKDPTPQYLATLTRLIAQKNIKVIFSEPQFSPRVVETIAHDTGAAMMTLDPVETGPDDSDAYERIMLKNAQALATGFAL